MGTRCFIAKKTPSGYKAIYSHWDGYPEKPGVGYTLKKYYTDPRKIDKLLALGDISALREEIGEKHDFDSDHDVASMKGWTTAYGRDRGETGTRARTYSSLAKLKEGANQGGAEYLYFWENGDWRAWDIWHDHEIVL